MANVLVLEYAKGSIAPSDLTKLEETLKASGVSLAKIPFNSTIGIQPIFRLEVLPDLNKD